MEKTGSDSERRGRESAALRLLKRVLAIGWFDPDAVARALVMSNAELQVYLTGSRPIPLDRQLCLAQFVIECIPPLARAGHRLRGQVAAAIAYHNGITERHQQPPPSQIWPSR